MHAGALPRLPAGGAAMMAPKMDAFHAHLDVCKQCREHPLNLCPLGNGLIRAAVESITGSLVDLTAPRGAGRGTR